MPYLTIKDKGTRKLLNIDDEYIGFVYQSDINEYDLNDGTDIDITKVEDLHSLIFKRTYKKALSYLERSEYCASEIRFKLKMNDYSSVAIERVIESLYKSKFLDDKRYAEAFIRSYSSTKGRKLMETELLHKNISSDVINDAFDAFYEDEDYDEDEVIRSILDKKYKGADLSDIKTKTKVLSYFMRKGFSVDKVNNHLT
ncbi:SOS response regulatory protein OraA/RecX, interacts with RecA [Eubacterium ruminantium]|uniref:Regulatory protein RecX n=1 Tax=Eubacterium ruminantium TaxID=42322 RepID=A0A1T4LWC2_9FIRM|nr:regulatory protein RecX [Eubacterium ruminantium]SCW38985.1 SOS response regulatory protein OraA/RecX, interacts with RecA [Eubacterium ruminantium]SDM43240.1 SOS response regulatory protein OraA/RecX, interacts with RecA [Eubacterium ruminantium]SJZ58982.1 SOS response regulatory protein OraA/RecX, interacts with RecA [Eubacterium ruminantium]